MHAKSEAVITQEWVDQETKALYQLVDEFSAAMKEKLKQKVLEGRGGWQDTANRAEIYNSMLAHGAGIPFAKNQEAHVANLAMILWYQRTQLLGDQS